MHSVLECTCIYITAVVVTAHFVTPLLIFGAIFILFFDEYIRFSMYEWVELVPSLSPARCISLKS